ncbi:MAG TPA: ABC transporter permease [Vicinamibacterales bacterium]|nr:ABC transporter permease [Vicinamibacterales bacterium]
MRVTQWLEERQTDARFALRQLRRAPGFAAVAVLTLALGIGANSAIFALADATLLRELPYAYPAERLVMLGESRGPDTLVNVSPLDFRDWSTQNRTFDVMGATTTGDLASIVRPDGTPEQLPAEQVTPGFFEALGVRPILGRMFQPSDSAAPRVVVLSEGLWRNQFGGDHTAIGRALAIGGQPFTVIGVVPASFQFAPPSLGDTATNPAQLWTFYVIGDQPWGRLTHLLRVVGRLKPGVTLEGAQADLDVVAARLAEQFPEANKGHGVAIRPLREALMGREIQLTSMLLLGVVGFVLLMCCANVASLLVAQAGQRSRELAVRAALGAGRGRVVAQLLTESLVLASIGGVLALAVAAALLAAAPAIVPPGVLPVAIALSFDARVAAACAVSALAVGVLFGLAPAWHASRGRLVDAMAADARVTRRGGWLRSGLVSVQVAAAVLVLCGAGLLLRALVTLQRLDSGPRASQVLTAVVSLPFPAPGSASQYPTAAAAFRFYEAIENEIRAVPGVRHVAWGGALPLDGLWFGQPFEIVGDPPKPYASRDLAPYHMVSPEYFAALDLPIVAGRAFTDADSAQAPAVCIVSEEFATRFLGGRSPVGMRLVLPRMVFGDDTQVPKVEIIGVARQVKTRAVEPEPMPHVYVPLAQNNWWMASLIVRPESGDAAALLPSVRAAVARVDRERVLARPRTMATIAHDATARPRFRAVLVGAFALLALMLATVGVFGVLTQLVQQRIREFGVRIALGASRTHVIGLVVRHAARITTIGLAVGLGLAFMLGRLLASLIFPIAPSDPITYTLAPLVALLTAAVACVAPAWRATRVDPATAFRED